MTQEISWEMTMSQVILVSFVRSSLASLSPPRPSRPETRSLRRIVAVIASGLDLLPEGIRLLPASLSPRALPLLYQDPDGLRPGGFPRVPLGQSQAEHAVKLQ
jgi:hypothetical protein